MLRCVDALFSLMVLLGLLALLLLMLLLVQVLRSFAVRLSIGLMVGLVFDFFMFC